MKIKKNVLILLLLLPWLYTLAQPLVTNDGLAIHLDVGLTATVQGAITNQTNATTLTLGTIDNAGTITLTGDWTNNSANTVFSTNTGLVQFIGTTAGQTIGGSNSTGFYALTINNTFATSPQITLGVNTDVKNTLTMTAGNTNLATFTLTLGTAVLTPGILSYTNGFLYDGTFTRWVAATSAAIGAIASNSIGHYPMGTSGGDYRPFWLTYSTDLTDGGTVSVLHDPTAYTTAASHVDGTWAGGTTVDAVTNSTWVVSTANGFNLNGATGILRFGGQGYGAFNLADVDASLLASVVGTYSAATSVNTVLEVSRTGLTPAEFANTWRIGTRDILNSPLPIELLSFDAKRNENKVDLKWTTATEMNNDFFTIERSSDAISFENIGIVDGAGNSTSVLNYTLVDNNPYKGVSYYRLKQTDFDGKYTYSNIVAVEFKDAIDFDFVVYPNPSEEGSTVNLILTGASKGEEVLVVVYDATGKEQYSKVIIIENDGNNVYAFDYSGKLSPGVYLITASSKQSIHNKKLIVK